MAERYDQAVARHYAAFRPPLHRPILARALAGNSSGGVGLDVGCGTGYSALALAEHCARVYGLDASLAMLRQATPHRRVAYLQGAAASLPLPDCSVDVVTFAGSLYYADSDATRQEIRRVCRTGAVVTAYDFEVLLEAIMLRCGIDPPDNASDYDHRAGLSGAFGFTERSAGRDRIAIAVTAAELAHVLLSDSHHFDCLAAKYRAQDPFPALERALRTTYERPAIEADIFYATYGLV